MEEAHSDPITYAEPLQEQLDYLVYDEKYELDPTNLKLLHTLGSGHFGDVYMGILNHNGASIPVAVKKTKLVANIQKYEMKSPKECSKIWQMERDSLRDELKIMTHIGAHPNVVRLLGAVTTSRDDYCLVTEYCEYGSLDAFLRNKKDLDLFVNEIVSEDSAGYLIRGRDCVYKRIQDTMWDSQFEQRRADGKLTTSDLLWFALQMARAMEYLTKHSVVHRDVALRNVLLKLDYSLKVADFGLSRVAGDDGYYYQIRNIAMPIRYTAPEAMKVGRFSEHSECWAYGIALWELFTFSKKQPYAEECPEGYQGIMTFLSAGNRLPISSTTPKPIRLMIQKLWHENPDKRPSFTDCQNVIFKELNISCPKIPAGMQLDYDLLSIKRTSLDNIEIVQNLHNFLRKKKHVPTKNIYYRIVSERQSRASKVTWCSALTVAVTLALIAITVAAFGLNCGSRKKSQDSQSSTCYSHANWSTENGQILLNGEQLVLKGVNYYGFETDDFAPNGLYNQSLDFVLDFMAQNDFNAVRLPFSIEMIQKNPETNVNCEKNRDICHLKALELMEIVIDRCADRGILVVLSCAQLASGTDYSKRNGLWYDGQIETYSEANVLAAWEILVERVKKKWNVFALDVLDQPHHGAAWGANDSTKDFNQYADRFVKHTLTKHAEYKGFFFVEGVHVTYRNTEEDKNAPEAFQGENLMGVRTNPISTGNSKWNKRIIYSPHSFGPDVWNQTYFKDPKFPKNMPSVWENFFGFITETTDNPVIVGSWGGKYSVGSMDETWQNSFASWLNAKCILNQFYWCLTGPYDVIFGDPLLSESAIPNRRKLELLNKLQPYPSKLVCYESTSSIALYTISSLNRTLFKSQNQLDTFSPARKYCGKTARIHAN